MLNVILGCSLVPFSDGGESSLARRPRAPLEHVGEAPLRQTQLLPQAAHPENEGSIRQAFILGPDN